MKIIFNSFLVFLTTFIFESHQAEAQSQDITINKLYVCRITAATGVILKNGTALTEALAAKEQAKLTNKLKSQKALLKSAKASGVQKSITKAKNKVTSAKSLVSSLKSCLNGTLTSTTTPTPTVVVSFPLQARSGSYTGTWNNTTFASSGSIGLTLSITDGVGFTLNLDLGGAVFGGGDPAAEEFKGTFSGSAPYIFSFNSPLFGANTVITIDANGDFQLDAPTPTNTAVTNYTLSIDFNDTAKTASGIWSLNLFGTSGKVNGTATLTKSN